MSHHVLVIVRPTRFPERSGFRYLVPRSDHQPISSYARTIAPSKHSTRRLTATTMGSSTPPEDNDDSSNAADVIKIDLTSYRHTGTYYRPNGPAYTFPPPEKFLKSLSRHFNTTLAADQEFHIYNGTLPHYSFLQPSSLTVPLQVPKSNSPSCQMATPSSTRHAPMAP